MSDLTNIVKFKTKELSEQKRQYAYEKCQEADNLVADALVSGRTNKALVKHAVSLYKESLDLYYYQVKPYLGLAYIMYSIDELEDAIGLLNSARKVDPHHSQVKQMLEIFIQKHKTQNTTTEKKAGVSLSDKLKDKKTVKKDSFFEKISAIFFQKTKAESKSNIRKQPDDFAMMLNETKRKMTKSGNAVSPVHKFINKNPEGEQR